MNDTKLPSQIFDELRDRFACVEATGVELTADQIKALRKNLLTAAEIARDMEEDLRIVTNALTLELLKRRPSAPTTSAQILPFRPRLNIRPLPDDGGDAA